MNRIHLRSFLLGGCCTLTAALLLGAAPGGKEPGAPGYKAVWDYDPVKFNKKVQLAIDDGWKVQGGVAASLDASGSLLVQALVK
jgi:hypothetical protein